MLNTIMALWNHNPTENRYRAVKILLVSFFISTSIFLLLFTFNSSILSLFIGGENHSTGEPNKRNTVLTGSNVVGTVSSTPTLMPRPTATPAVTVTTTSTQPCEQVPVIIANKNVNIPSHGSVTPAAKGHPKNNKQKHLHPKSMTNKKVKPHPTKPPEVKVMSTPTPYLPRPTETIPVQPVGTIIVQPATPVGTETDVPANGTDVPNVEVVPAPEAASMTPTPSFEKHMQNKGVVLVSGGRQDKSLHEYSMCSTPTSGNK